MALLCTVLNQIRVFSKANRRFFSCGRPLGLPERVDPIRVSHLKPFDTLSPPIERPSELEIRRDGKSLLAILKWLETNTFCASVRSVSHAHNTHSHGGLSKGVGDLWDATFLPSDARTVRLLHSGHSPNRPQHAGAAGSGHVRLDS